MMPPSAEVPVPVAESLTAFGRRVAPGTPPSPSPSPSHSPFLLPPSHIVTSIECDVGRRGDFASFLGLCEMGDDQGGGSHLQQVQYSRAGRQDAGPLGYIFNLV